MKDDGTLPALVRTGPSEDQYGGTDGAALASGPTFSSSSSRSSSYSREIHRKEVDENWGPSGTEEMASMHHRLDPEGDPPFGPSSAALSRRAILAYGTGHVLNDLTAACWFTYLLIFLTDVGLSSKQAGEVMLSGQTADGLATIVVGQLIDRFGHFKLWHSGGSLLVVLSFSSVFGTCISCDLFGAESSTVGYSAFAAIFNLGWASAQVSHMSLVNCITANTSSRVSLNSCRNAFSMIANLCLYAVAYAVFWNFPSTSAAGVHVQFQWITGVAVFVGCCFVFIFLLQVGEPKLYHHEQVLRGTVTRMKAMSWFKRPLYYQVALVYMLTRLTTNVSQAVLPFYVVQDLELGASSKAVASLLSTGIDLCLQLFGVYRFTGTELDKSSAERFLHWWCLPMDCLGSCHLSSSCDLQVINVSDGSNCWPGERFDAGDCHEHAGGSSGR